MANVRNVFEAILRYGHDEDFRNSLAAGFTTHLVKPINLVKLDDAIRESLLGPPAVTRGLAQMSQSQPLPHPEGPPVGVRPGLTNSGPTRNLEHAVP